MKKGQQMTIAGGLDNLLNPTPAQDKKATTAQEPEPKKERTVYKTVCYNLNPEIIEAVKKIAYWDRRKGNAVVTEALEQYIKEWRKRNGEEAFTAD